MATVYEKAVYFVCNEDIEFYDKDFFNWLTEQGDEAMHDAVNYFGEELSEYMDAGDFAYDCLKSVKRLLGYKED